MGHSAVLLSTIQARELELNRITEKLAFNAGRLVEQLPANVRGFVTGRLNDLLGLLNTDIARARAELATHVREIRMVPDADGGHYYFAEGERNLLGGLDLGGSDFAGIAGDCNAPNALLLPFRLELGTPTH
jgi:hypothetical protein